MSPSALADVGSAGELAELDRRHLIHQMHRADVVDRAVIVRGEGCLVWDADGNELLDAAGGGVWHSPLGHGRRDLAEVAARQMRRLEYFTGLLEFSNDQAIRLAARLAELAPEDLNKVFFANGGSEAVESAIKASRLYHHRRGQPDRTWILARHYALHGSTYGSGTLTGFPAMHNGVGPARVGADRIAAMIGEPVMAGGGVLTPPADYWPRIREVLRRHGILLIADEVVTAFGRTGAWFDSPGRGMSPDLIAVAKGIAGGYVPLGALLLRDEIGDTIASGEGFFHGYTFQGHPVACAVALACLDIIEREDLLAKAGVIAGWLRSGLAPAKQLPAVGDVRVEGTLAALEIVADRDTRQPMGWTEVAIVAGEVRRRHGVIVRPYGHNLVLTPPLVMDERQTRRATEAVVEVLSRLGTDGTLAPADHTSRSPR
ncbi:MAG: aspartate aminotransferase family protein [Actinobacteria bacterium 13_2_20CM_2_71_6]|nr:MAG: aspartate aminotransferase family protein [Actinobacteria bacterium 13_2_20CM_2_71_6]